MQAWQNWLAVLESRGFAPRAMTRPPASEQDLEALSAKTGVPGDLLDLYRISDGQLPPWRTDEPGATELFPCARFVPVAEALELWQEWQEPRVPFTVDADGGSLAIAATGEIVDMETGHVHAGGLVAYLEKLASSRLATTDDDGVLTWDVV
ncbi:hypothetical protein ALI144C_08715 [Actinosynnema sp. ALI-1.44]|uniref:SMI1/KNR4 family protein n=1 Tax=Actinosynnema sp. ALI-1.44 TaxID=1933779 RepID=UPI00097C38EF|nr:SMI1/KNR4 family protein [Actinosynnema sp. ALI-1.44]ONI87467.1 hypothetical protein ALI144C_08715 [Actinosynnema sp. ALI-1.44]